MTDLNREPTDLNREPTERDSAILGQIADRMGERGPWHDPLCRPRLVNLVGDLTPDERDAYSMALGEDLRSRER